MCCARPVKLAPFRLRLAQVQPAAQGMKIETYIRIGVRIIMMMLEGRRVGALATSRSPGRHFTLCNSDQTFLRRCVHIVLAPTEGR